MKVSKKNVLTTIFGLLSVALMLMVPIRSEAFCGFYVSGADAKLYNNATTVVLMRDGQRTILSMKNNYEGPPTNFAMVVPVPVVLQKENVKTLDNKTFDKVDKMAAPRLVEYWEQDPCRAPRLYKGKGRTMRKVRSKKSIKKPYPSPGAVKIEAQFKVGEYEIVILSATEAKALDTWLRQNKYNIPNGAEKVLKPYVESGMYFFVAKVDVSKVKFDAQQQAMLSPLRFYYDSETFNLPIRLGLINAKGDQDLIVNILARGQRYEAANYKNVTIPSNINVSNEVRGKFGAFYAALFDETLKQNPGSVVTEYAWDASTCDPCPGPNLRGQDFLTMGADVLPGKPQRGFVLTRLHARYNASNLGDDLVFSAAPPIVGGRERLLSKHQAEQGSQSGSINNFQGRYIIRHAWKGDITCQDPKRGNWGGPPNGQTKKGPVAAKDIAFAPRGSAKLASLSMQAIPELEVVPEVDLGKMMQKVIVEKAGDVTSKPDPEPAVVPSADGAGGAEQEDSGMGGCAITTQKKALPLSNSPGAVLILFVSAMLLLQRRRQPS